MAVTMLGIRYSVVGTTALLVACTEPERLPTAVRTASAVATTGGLAAGDFALEEEDMFRLGTEVPTYGGHFLDQSGHIVVWLTDLAYSDQARSAIRKRVVDGRLRTSGRRLSGDVEVRKGDYSIGDLAAWRKLVLQQRNLEGVAYVDLDEGANRIRVGVVQSEQSAKIESDLTGRLTAAGLPSSVLLFRTIAWGQNDATGTVHAGTIAASRFAQPPNLGAYVDTLVGGLRFVWADTESDSNGICTIGFVAEMPNGQRGFVSASHCSPRRFQNDVNRSFLQQPTSGPTIGFEQWDAPTLLCAWWEYWCTEYRYSDANIYTVSGREARHGYLARPSTRFHQWGVDTTIASGSDYLRVDGTTAYVVQGSTIDLIGATLGWRYGTVETTCGAVPVNPLFGTFVRCAYETSIVVGGGDSGGPVFYFDGLSSVTAAGILFRRTANTSWFSKWNHVYQETTGAWPAPTWINVVANDVPLTPTVTIVGPTEMKPQNSCYWYASANFLPTDFEWKVNGVPVGQNSDLTHTASVTFTLSINAWNGTHSANTSQSIVVSNGSSECFVQ